MKKYFICLLISLMTLSIETIAQSSFKVNVVGKGRPVILIPGYSCSGEGWDETVQHLEKNYTCHILTLPGFAGVPAIDTPILETVKNDIIRYVAKNKLQKPVVIGHSLGAFMALWVSSEKPELFGKLICVDGVPFISALTNESADANKLKKDPIFDMTVVVNNFKSLPDTGFIDKTTAAMLWQVNDTARARQIATWQYKSDRKTLGVTIVEMSTTDLRENIASITQPVLVLGSIYGNKETSKRLLEQQYKNVKQHSVHIADSKHFIMYDQPEWMYKEIDEFLSN